ncbi:Bax inhibitor-1/YccA family protein [Salinarimonas ramus]|uniref:Membrane protein n=1 Tax=Salinarimonas ramus TaxID=690164 RepID=A0A917V4T6_9HYPH|nr:Bax inhibitor-1/YccA family protein [Salinarimonas ramus]GGK37444.1 membrane protein [Salinarimonas ramus]
MNDQNRFAYGTGVARPQAEIDQGLRAFMLGVYNNMALGLGITGVVAFATYLVAASSPAVAQALYGSPLRWVLMLAPLAFIFFFTFKIESMSAAKARSMFFLFSAVMGLSLSTIFLVFTGESIVQVFFVTAAAFGGLSLYGYTTKRSLSGMGSFLIMGLIGLIIAMVVNIFLASSAMAFAISIIGVLIFAGLTAWDTQRLKEMYLYGNFDGETAGRVSVMGALSLYLNFINMFQFLLALMGNRE